MKKRVIAGIIIFALLLAAAGYKLFNKKEEGITATGTIEITQADITPKVGGYIVQLPIKEGDKVRLGQVIAHISRPDLEAQILRDQASLEKAQVQLRDLEKGSRTQERLEATANLDIARSTYEKAKNDYQRYSELYRQGAVSEQQLDTAKNAYEVAANSLLAVQSRHSLVEEGNRADVIAAQRLEVARNKAILEASRTLLGDTIITTPLQGLVITKNFEEGEYVNPGSPIATVGDLNNCWVKIYIASTQLGQIRVDQPVNIKVDSFPNQVFVGKIKEINQNAEYTPRQSITQKERANLVFGVKVKIDNADGVLKPGMPVDVVIK